MTAIPYDGRQKTRIMIFGPKRTAPTSSKFRTAAGEALAISIPRGETAMLKYFQEASP
jgi:hypothetical protein